MTYLKFIYLIPFKQILYSKVSYSDLKAKNQYELLYVNDNLAAKTLASNYGRETVHMIPDN